MSDEQIHEVAEWLRVIGYGFDWVDGNPLPEFLREPLAMAWQHHSDDYSVSVADWLAILKDEGAW